MKTYLWWWLSTHAVLLCLSVFHIILEASDKKGIHSIDGFGFVLLAGVILSLMRIDIGRKIIRLVSFVASSIGLLMIFYPWFSWWAAITAAVYSLIYFWFRPDRNNIWYSRFGIFEKGFWQRSPPGGW
jgi:hypothetical protein